MSRKTTISIIGAILFVLLVGFLTKNDGERNQAQEKIEQYRISQNMNHPLFSDDPNSFSMLIVGQEIPKYHEWMDENGIRNVGTIQGVRSLEDAKKHYSFLELEKKPAYVVFDTKGIVYKTYNENKLIEFLTSQDPNENKK